MKKLEWLLPRLPLPMLALAASYGVYQFALLFVPGWVAVVQASAFELTYVGLATIKARGDMQRRKAIAISLGAVVVSVLYNWLAGFFHRNPETLIGLDLWQEAGLAFLHGAPLAIVAYLVADLLLHNNLQDAAPVQVAEAEPDAIEADVQIVTPALQPVMPHLIADLQPMKEPMQTVKVDESAAQEDLQPVPDLWSDDMDDLIADATRPDGVSDDTWKAYRMCKFQGLSQADVAAIMGKSISTISRYCAKVEEVKAKEKVMA